MKKKVLVSSVLVIALCLCIIAGSTFALFTSKTQLNVAVTSANVSVVATLQENSLKAYSGEWDDAAKDYASVEVSANEALSKVFTNGGTVVADTATNEIKIDKITPMDKVEFTIDVTNYSDVTIKYRTVITTDAAATNDGVTLLDGLKITIDGTDTMGQVDDNTKASAWAVWTPATDVAAGDTKSINVVIELPNTGNDDYDNQFQGLAAALTYTVEAVQGNGHTVDDISTILAGAADGSTVTLPAEDYGTMTINSTLNNVTLDFANAENVDEIIIGADAELNNVTIVNFKADTDETGTGYADAIVKVKAGAEVTNLVLDDCYFSATNGKYPNAIHNDEPTASITLTNCTFDGLRAFWSSTASFADMTFHNCVFRNIDFWVIQHNATPYNGNLTVTGCVFENCTDGIMKLNSNNNGAIASGSFTFTNNSVDANCKGHDKSDAKWFAVNTIDYDVTATWSGNTFDGADWTPDASNGLRIVEVVTP